MPSAGAAAVHAALACLRSEEVPISVTTLALQRRDSRWFLGWVTLHLFGLKTELLFCLNLKSGDS